MYNSYIRPLSFEYRDSHQTIINNSNLADIPHKFHPQQDNYQKRIRKPKLQHKIQQVLIQFLQNIQHQKPPKQQNCCQGCCKTCQNCCKADIKQLCSQCLIKLCENCSYKPDNVGNCRYCSGILCKKCAKLFEIKESVLKLRSYPIYLKNESQLHFHDCKCQICHKR